MFDQRTHPGAGWPSTYRCERFADLASTNDAAMARAREGDPGQLWIQADCQSAGRGRQGRSWVSVPGNLFASLLLIDATTPALAPRLGFVAGVALAQSVRGLLGGDPKLALKWPNDLVYDGAKLSGLLLEASLLSDGRLAAVIGFGVNCKGAPADLPYAATHLSAMGSPASAQDVLTALADRLVHWLEIWQRGAGFAAVRRAWLAEALPPGTPLQVRLGPDTIHGQFETIDPTGQLVLNTDTGPRVIAAGDVFLA